MFGWEFPPFKSGGLGTACYDLTKGLARQGQDVTFVMPVAPDNAEAEFVKLISTNNLTKHIKIKAIKGMLGPYDTEEGYKQTYHSMKLSGTEGKHIYGQNIFEEVERYAKVASAIATDDEYDVIHAHDWMTYKAGMAARESIGKPLVVHIHATEFDRTGGNPNGHISHMEYEGLAQADIVIANSHFTKNNIIKHYQIPPEKIEVVHWGIEEDKPAYHLNHQKPFKDHVVLFLGRITIQKGPDYFVEAAAKVLQHVPNTTFVIAGSGDMMPRIIDRVVELGISNKIVFAGFLRGDDVHRAFQMADLYVMPSVSEPFGLVALEALKNKAPIIISNQSGASEVINHCLKCDFWDVRKMANMIINVLKHPALRQELQRNGHAESFKFNLDEPAKKCMQAYQKAMAMVIA